MTDAVLVLAWLVFAHLVADFVLQNDWIALNKAQGGRKGWEALAVHGFHVGLCLLPAAFAFGLPGIVYVVVVVGTHVLVDRWKVQATRRAERAALEAARKRLVGTGDSPASGLGSAWTPWPGMLFLADQALHLTIAIVGWLVLLEGVALQPVFVDAVNLVLRTWDRATVHAVVLTGIALVSLFLVNTRAAYYFVLALVSPRELPDPAPVTAATHSTGDGLAAVPAPSGYTVRVGPLVATVEPGIAPATGLVPPGQPTVRVGDASPPAPASAAAGAPSPGIPVLQGPSVPSGAPARIGATIGALERLLIVVFVLVGAEAAVGFVIAAKTIARFKQLDDRGFAEYYLLGTLASVSVAILSAIVAKAALGTIP
ncbi:MAG TPA: DUF3307 domain-containing protein [Candidatus Limnocylindrales bacterium]|nr:DUF3307 domain-containing protein [Candidatus Limnocylindrales bacterium]